MKAAITLITITIVVAIVVSIGLMIWLYLSGFFSEISYAGEVRTEKSLEVLSSCIKIEEAFQNKFFIRNCGNGVITNDTLDVYVDYELINFDLDPVSIEGKKTGTIILYDVWGIPRGQHSLRIVNPNTEALIYFEAELHDSCVLALDFDEGEGTIAYDKSRYKNNGILGNDSIWTRPSWVAGRFGKALEFDGSDNYVNISNDESLNLTDSLTVAAWIYPRGWGENQYGKIIHKLTGCCGSDGYSIYMSDLWDTLVLKLGTTYYDDRSNLFINFNKWQHVLATFNGTHVSLYKNNIGFNPISRAIPIPTNDKPVYIGNSEALERTFDGIIDSVRIFNESLTPNETIKFRII